MYKLITIIIFLTLCNTAATAQTGVSIIGRGSLYTYSPGKATTPKCLSPSLCTGGLVYTFTGKGNWDEANNWLDFVIPPAVLPAGFEIIINPSDSNDCVLNIPLQRIAPGAKLTVVTGKKFKVLGVLDTK